MNMRFWTAVGMVLLAAGARLIPHPANATPLVAMALFSGAVFTRKSWGVLIPLTAMLLSDLVLGLHDQMVSVYGSIILISMIGFALSKKRSVIRVAGASVASSLTFFAITNFTVWLSSGFYAHTANGLAQCYILALPFFRNGLIADLFFSGVLFGAWALVRASVPALDQEQTANLKGSI